MRGAIGQLAASLLWVLVGAMPGVASEPARADGAPPCEAGTAEATARTVQRRYEGIRDLRARFEQTNESATFGGEALMSPEPRRGRVVFAKPGKMRWTYQEPEESVVVSNGETLWIHDVEARSVTRLSVTAGFLTGAALQFLLGDGQLLESFEVEASRCDPDRVQLDLVPKQDSSYERLGLVADPETGDVWATSVRDLFGNLTRIAFSEIEVNRAPDPEIFEFEVPEGVELIEYDGSPSP